MHVYEIIFIMLLDHYVVYDMFTPNFAFFIRFELGSTVFQTPKFD